MIRLDLTLNGRERMRRPQAQQALRLISLSGGNGSKMSPNSTEEVKENTPSVASLRPAFTIAGTGVHLPPEQAFTITGIRNVLGHPPSFIKR